MITSDKHKIHWWGVGANGSASMFWALTNIFKMPFSKGAGGKRNDYEKQNFKKGKKWQGQIGVGNQARLLTLTVEQRRIKDAQIEKAPKRRYRRLIIRIPKHGMNMKKTNI